MVGAQQLSEVPLGIGKWFPVSYGYPRMPSFVQIEIALLTVIGFAGTIRLIPRASETYSYILAAIIGILCILGTTATQGIERGFVHPIAGRDPHAKPAQYWHDAERIPINTGAQALRFVREYSAVQPTLAEHGRTHPPGAVLLFALLHRICHSNAAFAAVTVCALAVALVAIGFRLSQAPPFALLLFCVLPAAHVYFCATLDAIIAGLLFITVASGLSQRVGGYRYATAFIALLAASFLTFGVVWVVPVLLAVEIVREGRLPWRSCVLLGGIVLSYMVLYCLTGFSYLAAFRFASQSENPEGFRLLNNPTEYLATRMENVGDLLFFAGPFVLWAAIRASAIARRQSFLTWIALITGVSSLILLFLAGAYRTGETARACLFLYPLIVRVAADIALSERERNLVLIATLTNAAVVQCAGFYFW